MTAPDPADALRRQAARLTASHTHRLHREDGAVDRVTLPPLLELLTSRVAASMSGRGGRTSPKSKPPIDVTLIDLLAEIDQVVTDACRDYTLPLRYLDGVVSVHTRDSAANLRQLVPAVIADAATHMRGDLVEWWTRTLTGWAARAEAAAGDREDGQAIVPLPACPDCHTTHIATVDDHDGETYRAPACVAAIRDHQVQHVTCRACAATWHRGPDLDALVAVILTTRTLLERCS